MHTLRMAAVPRGADRDALLNPKGARTAAAADDAQDHAASLPAALSSALAEFSRHLAAERALSRHTVRAYQGDIQSLLEYAGRRGVVDPGSLDLIMLRGWLANQHQAGAARATPAGARRPVPLPPTPTARAGSPPTPDRSSVPPRHGACCRRCCAGTR